MVLSFYNSLKLSEFLTPPASDTDRALIVCDQIKYSNLIYNSVCLRIFSHLPV